MAHSETVLQRLLPKHLIIQGKVRYAGILQEVKDNNNILYFFFPFNVDVKYHSVSRESEH